MKLKETTVREMRFDLVNKIPPFETTKGRASVQWSRSTIDEEIHPLEIMDAKITIDRMLENGSTHIYINSKDQQYTFRGVKIEEV